MNNFLEKLTPYLGIGVMVALFIAGLILLSYVLLWGVLIGVVLFGIAFIKKKLFPTKQDKDKKSKPVMIEYEE